MRGGVAKHFQPFGIPVGDDGKLGVALDDERRVDKLAIDLAGERRLRETRPDRRGDLRNRYGRFKGPDRAVRQTYINRHASTSRKKSAGKPHFLSSLDLSKDARAQPTPGSD